MKNFILSLLGAFATFAIAAQPPMGVDGHRPLPNQFRDFVDHQQKWNMERPNIVKKDGKVIITMSEEQFDRMREMKKRQHFRQVNFRNQSCCNQNCRPRAMRGPKRPRS